MALIPCKECGSQISKTAEACPQCGAKVPHTSLITKVIAVLFFLVFLIVISNAISPRKSTVPAVKPLTAPVSTVGEQPNLDFSWTYENLPDEMGRGTIKMAAVRSINEIEFGFPYQGLQRATLMLRSHPKHGKDVILTVERGQFLCGIDSCRVSVRFDEGKAQAYTASEPTDHRTTMLFISNYARFLEGVRKSQRVSVEATFYQEGSRVFEFNSSGLDW